MQAFKLYFKVMKKSVIWSFLMYVGIYVGIAMLLTQSSNPSKQAFETDAARVTVINNDNSEISSSLVDYLSRNTEFVTIDTSEDGIKDALFYREAEFVLTIPAGFGESFETGGTMELDTIMLPDAMSSMLVSSMIDSYLNNAKLYLDGTGHIDYERLDTVMSKKAAVELSSNGSTEGMSLANFFVNYTVYPIMAILIFSISTITLIFNKQDIRRRNYCAPVKSVNFSMSLFLGNLVMAFVVATLFAGIASIMYPAILSAKGVWWIINIYIFALVSLTLSFLISNLVSKNAVMPIANVITLGSCFLCGVFVPQENLSEAVNKINVIFPTSWFVRANDMIGDLSVLSFENMKPVIGYMLIEVLFAAAFLALSLVAIKAKRTK